MGSFLSTGLSSSTKETLRNHLLHDRPFQTSESLKSLKLPNVKATQTGWTLLHVLVWQHDLAGLQAACPVLTVNAQDGKCQLAQGNTALHLATLLGDLEAASVLLEFSADFSISNYVRSN